MQEIKELCRIILVRHHLSNRRIAEIAGVSHNTVQRYRELLIELNLQWDKIEQLAPAELDRRLNASPSSLTRHFVEPDFSYVHEERRKVGVTLQLLHEEYAKDAGTAAMSETEFRRRYHKFAKRLGLVMRQAHRPGENLFLDYSGKRPEILDPATGVRHPVELFVAVLGASKKTFLYATKSQSLANWCEANVRAFEYFGGVTQAVVHDNLKAAVTSISRTEGHQINFTYVQLTRHYNTFPTPTRARKPKDKAPVEAGVKLAQRWGIARLRHRVFTSIGDLNIALAEMTEQLNARPMRKYRDKSRNDLFDQLDRPALKPLPEHRFEFAEWRLGVVVPRDYHIQSNEHYYSVPYRYVGEKVRVRISASTIEVYSANSSLPIASHPIGPSDGGCTTLKEHQPSAHQAYAEEEGSMLFSWAHKAGEEIEKFAQYHTEKHRRPVLTLQALRGLRKLETQYVKERLNAACKRAISIPSISVESVRSMLSRRIENTPLRGSAGNSPTPQAHQNVRGPASYQ